MSKSVAGAEKLALALLVLWPLGQVHGLVPKDLATRSNVSCMLVFGDSTVDPGNNNHLHTSFKANFPPYGKSYLHGQPTGRFSNGKLPIDFIAEALGLGDAVPAFLDPDLNPERLPYGASFASASSGYDDLTAELAKVLSFSKQIGYLRHYKVQLRKKLGRIRGDEIVNNAIFVISAGTNDFLQNYYLEPNCSQEFTENEYENYLIRSMTNDIKEMHRLGAKRILLVGLPPMGCLPITMTLSGRNNCVDSYNQAATSFNSKARANLDNLKQLLGFTAAYFDIYNPMLDITKNPKKYGFMEATKGCCGSGTVEFGETCMGQSTCEDPERYIYWDSVHPTEKMYQILADEALRTAIKELLG